MLTENHVSLTTKLPFEDDEFDHVHIRGIARAVPENKVCVLIRIYYYFDWADDR